jgi:hypothetical protein
MNPVVRERTFEFGRGGGSDANPWGVGVNGGSLRTADVSRISTAPKPGTAEIWHLKNGGGGWDHPVHIHFEEAQTLARNGGAPPEWERFGRKDVWRLRPSGTVSLYIQFREFAGTYVEHCHNTVHEDHAMLLRWDVNGGPTPLPTPMPTPRGVTFIDSAVLADGGAPNPPIVNDGVTAGGSTVSGGGGGSGGTDPGGLSGGGSGGGGLGL